MQIPGYLLRTPTLYEPYLGDTATGKSFGASSTLRGHWEGGRRKVVDGSGVETVATATFYVRPDPGISVQDHITKGSDVYEVVEIIDNSEDGIYSPDHLELLLSPFRKGGAVR